MLLKPRFGSRMWSGIWPPSKPFTETPERLFWPFWPRPAVLPRPEPMPRPTRTRLLRAPGLSRSSLSFIVSALAFAFVAHDPRRSRANRLLGGFDAHKMRHLADLAENLGAFFDFDRAVHLVEAETDERRPLRLVAADRRAGLGDLDLCHEAYSVIA